MKSYILLVLLFSFFFNLNAQINTAEKRIEIDLKDGFFSLPLNQINNDIIQFIKSKIRLTSR